MAGLVTGRDVVVTPGASMSPEAWREYAERLTAVRHPCLARVHTTYVDDDGCYVLETERPEEQTLESWLASAPQPSLTDRLAILGMVASALDSLHAGSGGSPGVAHGAVSPRNVLRRDDGSVVLVGYTPQVRHPSLPAYLAPELQVGKPGSVAGDAYAFAQLVGEALIGHTLRRPLLAGRVNQALSGPPETRPRSLLPWLDGSTDDAATDLGDLASPPALPSREHVPHRRRTGGLVIAAGLALLLGAAAAAWAGQVQDGADPTSAEPAATPVEITGTWSSDWACRGSGVALQRGKGEIDAFTPRVVLGVLEAGGGAWRTGRIHLEVRVVGDRDVRIVDIKPHTLTQGLDSPGWIFRPGRPDDCEGVDDREVAKRLALELDNPTNFRDAVEGSDRVPLGPEIVVPAGGSATIAVDVSACARNHQWSVEIFYAEIGVNGPVHRHVRAGPFFVFGTPDNTLAYSETATGTVTYDGVVPADEPAACTVGRASRTAGAAR